MTNIGIFGIVALFVIVIALLGWIWMTVRANNDPVQSKHPDDRLKRGPVSGGAIHGDPGQSILTGDAPRQDDADRGR
jgi:hypothetical protein